eukprot:6590467-Lingulodinium_polyedra.AAC.1
MLSRASKGAKFEVYLDLLLLAVVGLVLLTSPNDGSAPAGLGQPSALCFVCIGTTGSTAHARVRCETP